MSFRIASIQASKSPFDRYKLGATIVKGGRILSTGYNELRYNRFIGEPTLHAEEASIVKLLRDNRLHDLAGSELYVTRITRGGNVACSYPCSRCYDLIRSVGITRIHFIGRNGLTQSESIN